MFPIPVQLLHTAASKKREETTIRLQHPVQILCNRAEVGKPLLKHKTARHSRSRRFRIIFPDW